ncbi:DNA-directed RNA polymerase subunit beta [Vagococcus fessus]|uniref:DNA-directed RNA polymerase subunit beta n=1 Tax=Vagococcus fessus TaxID=120370 RepID=A0A430ABF1_9ENTE|nr:DNA-directed RNA polymerase subunit beta [Vagococcus fessus]RSU04540.1 hypothetical protein CBF31_00530 [Vagococcus fessus]
MSSTTRYIVRKLIAIALFVLLALVLLAIGLMIGYGVVGDGNMFDVFHKATWSHISKFLN